MTALHAWRLEVIAAAESQLGVAEATNHNDGVPATRYCTMLNGQIRQVAWCAYFVRWCYRKAGIIIPGNEWMLASVDYLETKAKEVGRVRAPTELPRPGDIVLYCDRGGSDAGPGRHCGIVTEYAGGVVATIEGNVKHAVRRSSVNYGSHRVAGFCWF